MPKNFYMFMNSSFSILHYPFLLLFLIISTFASAAEIRFHGEPVSCTGTLVLLQDVAEVNGVDAETLRQTVLFAAPASGERRVVGRVELRALLSQLGINSIKHKITEPDSLTLLGGNTSPHVSVSQGEAAKRMTSALIETLEKQIAEALVVYLDRCAADNLPWNVTVKLTQEQAYGLATGGQIVEITGGSSPLTGQQHFDIRMSKPSVVSVDAVVELPQRAVVVRRSLPKGYIISASDVELRSVEKFRSEDYFVDLSAVIGMETTGVVREFSVLNQSMLRKPILVRKGDIVTVRSMNNGIIVRVNGKALDDGVKGATILVERIDDDAKPNRNRRSQDPVPTFTARVADAGVVEVYATVRRIEN